MESVTETNSQEDKENIRPEDDKENIKPNKPLRYLGVKMLKKQP